MTMSSSVSKVTLNGDGVQTSWPFAFKVWKAADLEVSITNAAGVTTVVSNWSVELASVGGTVTYPTSGPILPSGSKITVARSMDFLQDVDLVSGTRWDPEVVETALDQATAERQQLKEKLERAVVVDIADSTTPEALRDAIFEARDTAVDNATSALDSAERAEISASTVAYYNHEGTLLNGEDTITLPWAYDTRVGVEVFLAGVKQTESSLTFTDVYTVTLNTPVSADTDFEIVATAGARSDLANILASGAGSSLVGFLADGFSATPRTVQLKLRDFVSVKDYGAIGDGVTDDTAAFTAALAASRYVIVPAGTYRLTSTISLTLFGHSLIGVGGKNTTVLLIDHTTGPGITLAQGQCVLSGMTIKASDTRQSYTSGSTHDLASEMFGVKIYNASGSLTQCRVDRVISSRHPNHGFYMGGEGAGTIFEQCEAIYNRGHGYAFDDRTIGGGTSSRCGIITLHQCRATDNGGNGLHLSQNGSTCYRFIVNSIETLWNAWNTSISDLVNAEAYVGGENHTISTSAFADINGDTRTLMASGDARLGKSANLSTGIFIRQNANNIILDNIRYMSLYRGVATEAGVGALTVRNGYFTQQQVSGGPVNVYRGFDIGDNCERLHIDVAPSDMVETMVVSNTLKDWPLVANKKLTTVYSITATGVFEDIIGLTETVYLPVGKYRITGTATILNGTTAGANYSIGVALNGASASRASYASLGESYYATQHVDFIHDVATAATYTVSLQVRQATGNLGSVRPASSTFGGSSLQVERIL